MDASDLTKQRSQIEVTPVQASEVKAQVVRQTFLADGMALWTRVEAIPHSDHSRDHDSLASRRLASYGGVISKVRKQVGRRNITKEVRDLIYRMVADQNPGMGSASNPWRALRAGMKHFS